MKLSLVVGKEIQQAEKIPMNALERGENEESLSPAWRNKKKERKSEIEERGGKEMR